MSTRLFIPLIAFHFFMISNLYSQITKTESPQNTSYSTITVDNPYYSSAINSAMAAEKSFNNTQLNMGATDKDIITQQNLRAMQQMGYTPPVVPSSTPTIQTSSASVNLKSLQQQKEILELLNESYTAQNSKRFFYLNSAEYKELAKPFSDALQTLKDQLTGKSALSLKKAYYTTESAYGNTYLDYDEYEKAINESAAFIKSWLKQKGLSAGDNEALNLGIQQFMKDTLSLSYTNKDLNITNTVKHIPFIYDYEDFKGEKDYRNYFTTKCIATGTGQCNSLPGAYLLFAEALGAKAFLCIAPHHSFIKYPDDKGLFHGYEPTSNFTINDKWYVEHMFINKSAIYNKIYLDTLNKKMIVADCVFELAQGYIEKFGITDTSFLNDCIKTALPYFPDNNCLTAYFLQSMILARQLEQSMYKNGINDINKIDSFPETKTLYLALQKNEATIKSLGFQETPEGMYEEIMKEHVFKGTIQKEKKILTKEKRSLFITTNTQN